MGRKVGGGIGMGKTCEPKAFSFQCMTKFTTNKNFKKKEVLYVKSTFQLFLQSKLLFTFHLFSYFILIFV